MKQSILKIFSFAVLGFALISCSNPSKMAKESVLIGVDGNPKVLEVVADEITASYSITFPEGYFHPKAILEVVPVLVYEGGEVAAPTQKLQGEKITDNFNVIPVAGGKANNTVKFAYVPAWRNHTLNSELLFGTNLRKLTSLQHTKWQTEQTSHTNLFTEQE